MLRRFFINVSDIAAYIGQNSYDFITPFERMWKKYDIHYEKIIENMSKTAIKLSETQGLIEQEKKELQEKLENKIITKRQHTLRLKKVEQKELECKKELDIINEKINVNLSKSERVEKTFGVEFQENIKETIKDQTKDIETIKKETLEKIEKLTISDTKKLELINDTETIINTNHGIIREDGAIKMFETKYKVKLDTSQQYNKRLFHSNINAEWIIGGKVDGLYRSNENRADDYVVEVKNRAKGFFNKLRDYEKTQIQMYMWILNLNQARLVEKSGDKIKITQIFRDEDYIQDTLDYLKIYVESFGKFIESGEENKVKFIEASKSEKELILKKMYLTKIEHERNDRIEKRYIEKEGADACLIDDLDDF
jgi:hypothetical protein